LGRVIYGQRRLDQLSGGVHVVSSLAARVDCAGLNAPMAMLLVSVVAPG
jgi:hypothetical protein